MNEQLKSIYTLVQDIEHIILDATDPDIVGTQALHHEVEFIMYKLYEIRALCGSKYEQ